MILITNLGYSCFKRPCKPLTLIDHLIDIYPVSGGLEIHKTNTKAQTTTNICMAYIQIFVNCSD